MNFPQFCDPPPPPPDYVWHSADALSKIGFLWTPPYGGEWTVLQESPGISRPTAFSFRFPEPCNVVYTWSQFLDDNLANPGFMWFIKVDFIHPSGPNTEIQDTWVDTAGEQHTLKISASVNNVRECYHSYQVRRLRRLSSGDILCNAFAV